MKSREKRWAIISISALLSIFVPLISMAEWQRDQTGWKYLRDDHSYPISSWFQDTDGRWYHFDENGYMQKNQWLEDRGKQYYLSDSGAMLVNTATPDGKRVDGSGARMDSAAHAVSYGWQKDGTGWWYLNPTGDYIRGKWKTIDGQRYYFDESGYIVTGLQTIDGQDCYFDGSGALVKKDFVLDGLRYMVDKDGFITDVVDINDYYYGDRYPSDGESYSGGDSGSSFSSSNAQPDGFHYDYALKVVDIVNEERASRGLEPLEISDDLMDAAQQRSEELLDKYSHTRPDGSKWYTLLEESGISYSSAGENIAYGVSNPTTIMNAWMNSSGHKANILDKRFTKIGVGCYIEDGVGYWCQNFISD